jgi:hypothetical protein
MGFPLERIGTGLAGPDAHDLFKLENEDFPVTDLAGVRGLLDRFDDAIEHVGLDRGFDFDFRKKVDDVFRATVKLGVALLTSEALDSVTVMLCTPMAERPPGPRPS